MSGITSARQRASFSLAEKLGGGAFGNDEDWIVAAMRRAFAMMANVDLDVKLVSLGEPSPALAKLITEFK